VTERRDDIKKGHEIGRGGKMKAEKKERKRTEFMKS